MSEQRLKEQPEYPDTKEGHLASTLDGYANSLLNGWIPYKGVLGNLLIILESEGYLKKSAEVYVKTL